MAMIKRIKNRSRSKNQDTPQRHYVPPQRHQLYQAKSEPIKEYEDIASFVYNWAFSFLCLFLVLGIIASLVLIYLSKSYDETLWKILFGLFVIFFLVSGSACLALWVELPDFLAYILRWASIINFLAIATFSFIVFLKNYFLTVNFNETFWKIVPCVCILWLISAISIGIAWLTINNRHNPKKVLLDFLLFALIYAGVFYFLLFALSLIISSLGRDLLGNSFDETYWKLVGSICYIGFIAFISGILALFCEWFKLYEYSTGSITWNLFRTKIFSH